MLGLQKAKAKQKALILQAKDLVQFSNRKMANLLLLFLLFDGVDVSYKTIERAYSDSLVRLIIHSMFVILVKRKGIKQADLTGDGGGYSLTVTRHYRSVREKAGGGCKINRLIQTGEGYFSLESYVKTAPATDFKMVFCEDDKGRETLLDVREKRDFEEASSKIKSGL